MKSIRVIPKDSKEYDTAFFMMVEYGKERKRITLEDDDEISFVFLINRGGDTTLPPKVTPGKSSK